MSHSALKYINKERIEEIESLAVDYLQEMYGSISNFSVPLDLDRASKIFNVKIVQGEFTDLSIEGQLIKSKTLTEQHKIQLAKKDLPYLSNRQYFTIAHEIGHLVLHPELETDIYRTNFDKFDLKEEEADYFAGCLLMPRSLIIKAFYFLDKSIDQMAEYFNVSQSAMNVRVRVLGLI